MALSSNTNLVFIVALTIARFLWLCIKLGIQERGREGGEREE